MSGGKVYIVDDDVAFSDSLNMQLQVQGYDVATFSSPEGFLAKLPLRDRACVLIDVHMPGMSGISLLRALKDKKFSLPCVMMTGAGDVPLAVEAMKLGAFDFIEKPFENRNLIEVLKRALELARKIGENSKTSDSSRQYFSKLTPRELDVVRLLVHGKPNKIVAHELKISPRTVELHRSRIMLKLSASSFADVVRMAIAAELID